MAELLLEKFLGQWVEVELEDGRLIRGQLAGTDREPNFILLKAEERWDRSEITARHIGMAMVKRKNAKKILLVPSKLTDVMRIPDDPTH